MSKPFWLTLGVSVISAAIFGLGLMMAAYSIYYEDQPGFQAAFLRWSMIALPLLALISLVATWVLYYNGKEMAALSVTGIPIAALIVVGITFLTYKG